jgi:hypothetical protein
VPAYRALLAKVTKYSPSQPRDDHGRFEQVHHPERLQHAAAHTARHALISAAALSNVLASVEGVHGGYFSGNYFEAAHHAIELAGHLRALHYHARETYAGGRETVEASKPAMRQLRDYLANAKDHIARIDAEARGDHKAARLIHRRIKLRERAMALRMGEVKRPSWEMTDDPAQYGIIDATTRCTKGGCKLDGGRRMPGAGLSRRSPRKAPLGKPAFQKLAGGIEETSASFEARSAPRSYPTEAALSPDCA